MFYIFYGSPLIDSFSDLCPAGTYQPTNKKFCSSCEGNTISAEGASFCTPCAAGSFETGHKTICGAFINVHEFHEYLFPL
jgi:hypothetical protein